MFLWIRSNIKMCNTPSELRCVIKKISIKSQLPSLQKLTSWSYWNAIDQNSRNHWGNKKLGRLNYPDFKKTFLQSDHTQDSVIPTWERQESPERNNQRELWVRKKPSFMSDNFWQRYQDHSMGKEVCFWANTCSLTRHSKAKEWTWPLYDIIHKN